jgi:nucleoside-diphosphate-sugar epimerase
MGSQSDSRRGNKKDNMKIVITGAAGYIGSTLVSFLSEEGHEIVAFDNLIYDQGTLVSSSFTRDNVTFYKEDVNEWSQNLIDNIIECDVLIPLAALVGAPLCDKKPQIAKETNHMWFKKVTEILKESCLVIYPNTNSGYGTTGEDLCTEETPSNPISLYAVTKQESEEHLLSRHHRTICFRLATVFGWSPRPRTDLLVNNLTKIALADKKIEVFDGHFRRNYIHVKDIARAFSFAISNQTRMKGQVYNLGNDSVNMSKLELVKKVCKLTGATYSEDTSRTDPDKRDYIVSSQKLYDQGFKCSYGLDQGIEEMKRFFRVFSKSDEERCKNY